MKRRKGILSLLVLAMCMVMTACGAGMDNANTAAGAVAWNSDFGNSGWDSLELQTEEYNPDSLGMNTGFSKTESEGGYAPGDAPAQEPEGNSLSDQRKLIRTVSMSVETREFDSVMGTLEQRVTELGGYIESMETYNGSAYSGYRTNRSASMTARIPAGQLNGFLSEVSEISNVTRRSENVQDVTLEYVDMASHKKTLQAEHDRLLELMEQAESIEDIITIEQRLSNVQYQIESMEAQLRTYDNKVDYSTVYLDVNEVQELTPVQEETLWERISGGFMDDLKRIGNGALEIVVALLIHIPTLLLWALIVALFVLWLRWCIMRSRRKEEKKKAAMAGGNPGAGSGDTDRKEDQAHE